MDLGTKEKAEKMDPRKPTLVMKFGGTSVGTVEAISQVIEIVRTARQNWPRLVVITSALSGVTNLLLRTAMKSENGGVNEVDTAREQMSVRHAGFAAVLVADPERRRRAVEAIDHLLDDFSSLCKAISVLGEATPVHWMQWLDLANG